MKYYYEMVDLIEESYKLYRENFNQLIIVSGIQSLIGLYSYLYGSIQENPVLQFTFLFIGIVLTYYSLKLGVTMLLLINDRINNIQSTWNECYERANENIWIYIGAVLMLGIIVGIPLLLLVFGFVFSSIDVLKILIILIGGPIVIYLFAHYFFAPVICILNPEVSFSLKKSFELVKKDRTRVFYFAFTIIFLQFGPALIFENINVSGIVINSIETLTYLFLAPLISAITLKFYLQLSKNSDEVLSNEKNG